MGNPYDDKMTRLQFGVESIRHLIRQKVSSKIILYFINFQLLFNIKDNIGLIFKGTDTSDSDNGINIMKTLDFPSIQFFQELEGVITEDKEGDRIQNLFNIYFSF